MTNAITQGIFVDFIANLPSELSLQILFHLIGPEQDWSSIWHCLMVSKTWRVQILSSSIWRSVRLDRDPYEVAVVCSAIPAFMDKVQELSLASIPLDILSRSLTYLDTGGFSSLKSLSLEGTTVNILGADMRLPRLSANRMLTHLRIRNYRSQSPNDGLSIANVLSTCRNLTHLSYEIDGWLYCSDILRQPTNIVRLELRYRRIVQDPLRRILQQCPKLRSLLLDQCCGVSILSMIRRICPNLSALCYNMYSFMDQELPVDDVYCDSSVSVRGLQHFYVSSAEGFSTYPYGINDARAYMDANCSTLQDLRINVPENEERPHIPPSYNNSSVVFSNLHTIHCYDIRSRASGGYDYAPLLACIIKLSPNLEQSRVQYFEEGLAPILHALASADRLQGLDLAYVSLAKPDTAAFRAFLDRQVNRPTIKSMTITRNEGITDTCLIQLASIRTIQRLGIFYQKEITLHGLSSYASMCPSTEVMEIEGLQNSAGDNLDAVLQVISQMMFLKSISVTFDSTKDGGTIPLDGLRYILQHSKSIRHVRINESAVKQWCHENVTEASSMAEKAKSKGVTVVGLL